MVIIGKRYAVSRRAKLYFLSCWPAVGVYVVKPVLIPPNKASSLTQKVSQAVANISETAPGHCQFCSSIFVSSFASD